MLKIIRKSLSSLAAGLLLLSVGFRRPAPAIRVAVAIDDDRVTFVVAGGDS